MHPKNDEDALRDACRRSEVRDFMDRAAQKIEEAEAEHPGVDPDSLLVPLPDSGGAVQTVDQFNATGRVMAFACMPVSELPVANVPGSVRSACEKCAAAIWVALSTMAIKNKLDRTRVVCVPCVLREIEAANAEKNRKPAGGS